MYSYSTELSYIDELGVVVIPAVQGDTKRVFKFNTDLDLSSGNYTGQIDIMKNPDDPSVTYLCEIENNNFIIDTSKPDNAAFLSTPGTLPAQLSVTDSSNGGSITTWTFKLQIQENIFATNFPEDTSLIDKIKNLVSKAISVYENTVQNFIKSKTEALRAQSYATGDAKAIDSNGNIMPDTEFRPNQSTDNAKYYSNISKSYADGTGVNADGTPIRTEQSTENAKVYMEEAKRVSDDAVKGANKVAEESLKVADALGKIQNIQSQLGGKYLQMKGTIEFKDLPTNLSAENVGYMYNIKDGFTVDSRFVEYDSTKSTQAKKQPGTNVYVIEVTNPTTSAKEYKWDVMTGLSYWVGTDEEYKKLSNIDNSILYFTIDNDTEHVPSGNVIYNGSIEKWKDFNLNQILTDLNINGGGSGGSSDTSKIYYMNDTNLEWNGKSLKEIIDIIYDAVDSDHKIYTTYPDLDFSTITTVVGGNIVFNYPLKVNVKIDGDYYLAKEYEDYAFLGNLENYNNNPVPYSEAIEDILVRIGKGTAINSSELDFVKTLIFYEK